MRVLVLALIAYSLMAADRYRWVNVTMNAPFAPRDRAGALSFKERMWLMGGWNPKDKVHFPLICSDDVWSSADGASWTRVSSDPPWAPRVLHYSLAFKDRLWVIGGQTMPGFVAGSPERFHRDIWTSADGVRWEQLQPVEPFWSARGMIGGTPVHRGRIWILGGGTYDTPATPKRNFYNDVWSSADGIRWKLHTPAAPWFPRQYHDVAVWDGRLWVMEGYNAQAGNRNDVWHSPDGEHWEELPGTPWKPRHAASVFVHGGRLWIVAGNNMESDVWMLERVR
jgi:hypothetical protein